MSGHARFGRVSGDGPPAGRHTGAALTERETEIVGLMATGLSNQAIADRLVLSRRTVENHLHRAYVKLGVSDRAQVARLAGVQAPEAVAGS